VGFDRWMSENINEATVDYDELYKIKTAKQSEFPAATIKNNDQNKKHGD
jgi:hypothetical protein